MICPKILCLALLCSVATARDVPDTGVYNGKEAEFGEFPFMAALRLNGETKPFCGGAILDSHHVLTAAHCFNKRDVQDVEVVMGVTNIASVAEISRGQKIKPKNMFEHPKYLEKSLSQAYDFAILRLKTPIRFTETVKPICLPSSGLRSQDLIAKNLIVAGWGKTEKLHEEYSKVLLKTSLDVVNMENCRTRFPGRAKSFEDSTQLCCQGVATGTFKGDSGGPIFRKNPDKSYEILGIVSLGSTRANEVNSGDPPSVYTFIPPFLCSINNTISITENRQHCR